MLIRFTGYRKLDYNLSILSPFENWSQNLCPDMDLASDSVNIFPPQSTCRFLPIDL